jgi:hypothetical protein
MRIIKYLTSIILSTYLFYKFKRYEDASLEYIGINRHEGEDIGLFDTVLSRKDYEASFINKP